MINAAFASSGEVTELVRRRVRGGARFAWLFGDRVADALLIRYVIVAPSGLEHYSAVVTGPVDSLVDECPGASWHEREAHESFGIDFTGEFLAPLVSPGDARSLRRNHASEVSTIAYGPVRSGIVESACWVIDTAGEDFLHVEPAMFYKRRKLEERCADAGLDAMPLVAEHISGATAVSHAIALSAACERALGITVSQNALVARAALLELERIHQHLDALAKLADDASLSVGSSQVYIVKERVHRLLAEVTGSRFGRATICIGGLRLDALERLRKAGDRELASIESDALQTLAALFSTPSLMDRLVGTGPLPRELVRKFSCVGPVARGSGVSCDARLHGPHASLNERDEALESGCDALARAWVRRNEIARSFALVHAYLASPAEGLHRVEASARYGGGFSAVESPQGELLYFVRFDPESTRVAVRSASYQNWPAFVPSLRGNIFTDFSFIEHSFGLNQSEVDR